MSNLEHFNLGPVSDVDPDVVTNQILNALGFSDKEESEGYTPQKAMDSLTDLMQRVAEGKVTSSAALSLVKAAGLHNQDVEDAIVAQSVIGRKAIAKHTEINNVSEDDALHSFGRVDVNEDGKVDSKDLLALVNNWGLSGTGDVNNDGIVNIQDVKLWETLAYMHVGSDTKANPKDLDKLVQVLVDDHASNANPTYSEADVVEILNVATRVFGIEHKLNEKFRQRLRKVRVDQGNRGEGGVSGSSQQGYDPSKGIVHIPPAPPGGGS